MAAPQTKGHEEDKHNGMQEKNRKERKEKRKVGGKAQTQARKSYSRRLHSNTSSRLRYKAETGTLPHHLPSYSCSRRQRYQVSQLPLLSHPPANKSTKTEHNCQDSGVVATQVHLLVEPVRCHTIYHFISAFVDSRITTATPLSLPPSLVTPGVLCCVA